MPEQVTAHAVYISQDASQLGFFGGTRFEKVALLELIQLPLLS